MAEECSYWADLDENLIGAVFRDVQDNDFGWIMLARDRIGRFRCIDTECSFPSERQAMARLRLAIAEASRCDLESAAAQGDEPNAPFDLLTVESGTAPTALHPYFRELIERPGCAPARAVIREIGPWLAPCDPHFVREFQQHQFDQRLWELYLWAAFRELGFDVTHLEAPDFRLEAPGISFTVEATTVAPSTMGPLATHPDPKTQEEITEFLANYMPLKYGSSLTSKLEKTNSRGEHYWETHEAKNKPFVLAIADFHKAATENEPASMTFTQSALWQYLYGQRVTWERHDNQLVIVPEKVAEHKYGDKAVPSGFFDLELARSVSAVLFSNAGTIAKFYRIGVLAGFAADKHKYLRVGLRVNPDPNAATGIPFHAYVGDSDYEEFWSDELQVFHNPNATHPLPPKWFGGIAQHFFRDGDLHSFAPERSVLSSYTVLMHVTDDLGRDSSDDKEASPPKAREAHFE